MGIIEILCIYLMSIVHPVAADCGTLNDDVAAYCDTGDGDDTANPLPIKRKISQISNGF